MGVQITSSEASAGGGGGGTGNVNGPNISVDNDIVLFDGVTGRLIKDSGVLISQALTAIAGSPVTVGRVPYSIGPNSMEGFAGFTFAPTVGLEVSAVLGTANGFKPLFAAGQFDPAADNGITTGADVSIYADTARPVDTMVGVAAGATYEGTTTLSRLVGVQAFPSPNGPGVTAEAIGVEVLDVAGAVLNRAIKTGLGDIVLGTLAAAGNKPVKADVNGKLSAVAGASGSFTTVDLKTVTVVDGIITAIV